MLATLVATAACLDVLPESPLAHAHRSEEALVEAVLAAVEAGDQDGLRAALLTREEYETLVWPAMPDGAYTDFNFVWALNEANTRKGMRQLRNQFTGVPMRVIAIDFTGDPEIYADFTLHMGVKVTVRRLDTGDEGLLPSFDTMIDYRGAWKLLNYGEL